MATQDAPAPARADNILLGMVLMIVGMATLNAMDAISKYLAEDYSGIQVAWGRYFFHLLPLLVLLGPTRMRTMLRTDNLAAQIFRATALVVSSVCIIFAFSLMKLADAIAVSFIAPLLMVALSARFLGEHVGIHRWIAVIVGFAGMLVLVWPSGGLLDIGAVFAVNAAIFWAIGLMLTRKVRGDSPLSTLFYTAFVGTVLISLAAPFFWIPPDWTGWALMVTMGLLGGTAHTFIILAFRHASASLLAPFNYTLLIWAILYGWIIFDELPGARALFGAAIIVASGLYAWHRERKVASPPRQQPQE